MLFKHPNNNAQAAEARFISGKAANPELERITVRYFATLPSRQTLRLWQIARFYGKSLSISTQMPESAAKTQKTA